MSFSVVIPIYACSDSIEELAKRLKTTLEKISNEYEIIFVNDASPQNDWEIIKKLSEINKHIKGINLSRNFGQHYAITAGLEHAKGEWIIVMDGDLQDQPEEIIKLYNKANEDFDIVYARRYERKDNFFKKAGSILFYKILSYLTETKQESSIANFGIYKAKVIDAVLEMKDSNKYFPTMNQWVGYKSTIVNVAHSKRKKGKSAYSMKKLLVLAFNNMIAFSNKPLKLMIQFGFTIVFISLILAVYYMISYITGRITVLGFTSLILSIWFLAGIIILTLGILGVYIGRVFDEVKDRPNYLITEKVNF